MELGKGHTPTSSGATAHPGNELLGCGVAGSLAEGEIEHMELGVPTMDGGLDRYAILLAHGPCAYASRYTESSSPRGHTGHEEDPQMSNGSGGHGWDSTLQPNSSPRYERGDGSTTQIAPSLPGIGRLEGHMRPDRSEKEPSLGLCSSSNQILLNLRPTLLAVRRPLPFMQQIDENTRHGDLARPEIADNNPPPRRAAICG